MTEHHLPDNMEKWPANPFALFGVQPGVSERDLRKAYHKLIKRFKPEHAPDQFRRLNDAYESLRIQVRYETQFRKQEETDQNDDDGEWMAGTSWRTVEQETDHAALVEQKRSDLWRLAINGDLPAAAREFETLCDENPDDEELLLRLYWLKRLTTGQPPLDRLERFLKTRGPACRSFPMYLLELERNSSVALRESSRELLLTSVIEHETTQIAQAAWIQLVRQRQFIRIGHDLDALKADLSYDHPSLWSLVIYQAAEILALTQTSRLNPLLQRLIDEIRECEPMSENEWIESRWSLVRGLVFDNSVQYDVPERLLSLIRDSMLGEPWEYRYRLEQLAEPWIVSPTAGLSMLDRLRGFSSSAVYLLHQFANQLLEDRSPVRDQEYFFHLDPRLIEFCETQSPESYADLRVLLVQFCRTEDLELDLFVNGILELEKRGQTFPLLDDQVISALNEDWPLRCLIACVRLFNE